MEQNEIMNTLSEQMNSSELELVKQHLIFKSIKTNNLVFAPGDDNLGALVVKNGSLRVFTSSENGREITLFKVSKSEPYYVNININSLMENSDISIEAETNTEILFVDKKILLDLMSRNTTLKLHVYEHLLRRMAIVLHSLQKRVFIKVESRIAELLLNIQKKQKTNTIKITQDEIAKNINSVRVVVTRTLSRMKKSGAITLKRGSILINDSAALEDVIDN